MIIPPTIESEADLRHGMAALSDISPIWAALCQRTGCPPLRRRTGGFEGLAQIVVGQQVSVASAKAIWTRTLHQFAPLTAATILSADDELFRLSGLSRPKQRTLRAIAAAIAAGSLDLDSLETRSAYDIHEQMTAVSGIGPWTADIYLLFCLGHRDAFAPGDLALQEAARQAFSLPARPSTQELAAMSQDWRPWRGVAARLLWADYALTKNSDGIAIAESAP